MGAVETTGNVPSTRTVAVINRSIARRYARALFGLVEADPTDTAEKLSAFAELVGSNQTLKQVLSNPTFSLEERTKVLARLLKDLGWTAPLDRFIELLVERHRMVLLTAIAEEFSAMVDEAEGRLRVTVESAVALDEAALSSIKAALAKGLSKQIIIQQQVEPELLAGLAVRIGGLVVDGSLRSQLTKMKEQLARSRA
jgi:F-type H+-transporting ATPase subunit delta